MDSYLVQGQRVTLPVEVREATACSSLFVVPTRAAREVIAHTGLELTRPAICSLAFIRYVDTDLGPYNEFAVAFLVRAPGGGVGAYLHWLPVTQDFTLEAGRTIWGFPKELADIDVRFDGPSGGRCIVRQDGELVLAMRVKPGLPTPAGSGPSFDAFTCLDGVVRRTPWAMRPTGTRSRPGGAVVVLGDHPIASQLRSLGFPRTALLSSSVAHLSATFAGPTKV